MEKREEQSKKIREFQAEYDRVLLRSNAHFSNVGTGPSISGSGDFSCSSSSSGTPNMSGGPPAYLQSTASYQSQNLPSGNSPLASKASSHSNSNNSISSSSNRTSRVFQDQKFAELSLDENQSPPPPPIPRTTSIKQSINSGPATLLQVSQRSSISSNSSSILPPAPDYSSDLCNTPPQSSISHGAAGGGSGAGPFGTRLWYIWENTKVNFLSTLLLNTPESFFKLFLLLAELFNVITSLWCHRL